MNKIDKARIYINNEFPYLKEKVVNSDIKIDGYWLINGKSYDSIMSPENKFFPFPYTETVEKYFLSTRKEKLERIIINQIL